MDEGFELLFEYTIRAFLGDKASHIAGQAHTEKHRKDWCRKVLTQIIRRVQDIDTSTKHREQMIIWSERALNQLKGRNFNEPAFALCLLRLVAVMLGLVGIRPYNIATPVYFQTQPQYYTEIIMEGGDPLQDYYDKKSSIEIKKKLVTQLNDEGYTDFEISMVFNTSEYEIKKLRKEL
ncbi:hypothetical protein HNQ57_003418 [Zhongshania antarctica]|uniref:Uncharacterized protein n=1 Tax=Zhongshania antarctica TaxID=641702 RepID=A0A840R9C4_9GAMM|nr:hypothetical protein [Zhongshania antarctica]MBB5189118.1 hypothetical protein [Zhongshania antarctica]